MGRARPELQAGGHLGGRGLRRQVGKDVRGEGDNRLLLEYSNDNLINWIDKDRLRRVPVPPPLRLVRRDQVRGAPAHHSQQVLVLLRIV